MPVDLDLLEVGDTLWTDDGYVVRIESVEPPRTENGWPTYAVVWNGANRAEWSGFRVARLTPYQPKPKYSRLYMGDAGGYERAVARAAESAAKSRKVWAERRKAKRAAEKAAKKEGGV